MSVVVTVNSTLFVAPGQPAPAPSAITAVIVPKSVPPESYFLALYMLPAMVSVVSTHIFMAMFDVLTTVVSQLVILYSNPNVCDVQLSELPCVMTCRFSLLVGGGIGVIVKVGEIVGVRVLVNERFGVMV
jgi:hypothetical protein